MAEGKFGGGSGTIESPYLIEDVQDLNAIRFNPSSNFKLANSINLSVYPYNVNYGWMPIDGFYGTLDGDGHKIMNLFINRPQQSNVGLFGKAYENTNITLQVKNLYIENASVVGKDNVGIVFGSITMNEEAKIQTTPFIYNCKIKGHVEGNNNLGMAIGSINWATTINNACIATNEVMTLGSMKCNIKGANYSGVIGLGQNYKQSIQINHTISDVSFNRTVNGIDTDLNPYFYGTANIAYTLTSAFFNSETWTYGDLKNGKTLHDISYKNNLTEDFDKQLDSNSNLMWYFEKEKLPQLTTFLKIKYLIKCSKGYYVYDFTTSTWTKVLDTIKTKQKIFDVAMYDIDKIPFQAWDTLKKDIVPSGEKCEVLSVYEYSNGTETLENIEDMTASTEQQTDEQLTRKYQNTITTKVFSQKISFTEKNEDGALKYGDVIYNIAHNVIQ